jgi:hypothetical protein
MTDRVEHARGAKRTAAPEKGAVERADLGGDGSVETTDTGDGFEHYLTLVR